LIIDKFEE